VLPRLNGVRIARVVQFLYEAGLIAKGRPIVDLAGADLSEANLSEADLIAANLSGADLSGATMPNGQNYEDWLKSKDREKDGQNDGSS
jgi:uncharacterized protein YjbI with pentapeptide repeats